MTRDGSKRKLLAALLILAASGLLLLTACGPDNSTKNSDTAKPSGGGAVDSKARGAQIVGDFHKADGAPYSKGRIRMTIAAAGEPTAVYEADILRKQTPGERVTLTHVVKPEVSSDTASLSVEKKDEKT